MKYNIVEFADAELRKYLDILGLTADIKLGLYSQIGSDYADSEEEDGYEIKLTGGKGYIAASNERSVLFGVYRLLHELGIRFIRPGNGGTYYPKSAKMTDLDISSRAAKKYRVMCIEGAVSVEDVLDMIEWLPKVGFNGYYIQFSDAFIFFDRWYSHRNNPIKSPEPIDYDTCRGFVRRITEEAKRRGILVHRMGHGWTCDPFGVENHGWDPVPNEEIPDSYREICAMVGGKREVWRNMPVASQLCFSNSYVVETMSEAVVRYFEENPDTDAVHFWLGDYYNNYCECPECAKYRPADMYVRIVNSITDKMAERGINKKIFIINGYNLGYPPISERIRHPDMAVLTFAPISRTFSASFPEGFKICQPPVYKSNSFDLPRSVEENLAYLYKWEEIFEGDVIDFDYHLMWDHILDAGGEGIAKIIHKDIKNFSSLGICGYISCQLQRNAFPTSIAMTTMAKTLWDTECDFDEIRRELYGASFGEEWVEELCSYFSTLSLGFDIGALRSQSKISPDLRRENICVSIDKMEKFLPVIEQNLSAENPCHRESWELLYLHNKIYHTLGLSILAHIDGDPDRSEELRQRSAMIVWENEDKLKCVLDSQYYELMTKLEINLDGEVAFYDT